MDGEGIKEASMNLIVTTKEAARILRCDEATVRRRIRDGVITHVITNGYEGHGARYLIDLTKEYGIKA